VSELLLLERPGGSEQPGRGVAQPGSAPGSGPGGRRFKSSRPDHSFQSSRNTRRGIDALLSTRTSTRNRLYHHFRGFSITRPSYVKPKSLESRSWPFGSNRALGFGGGHKIGHSRSPQFSWRAVAPSREQAHSPAEPTDTTTDTENAASAPVAPSKSTSQNSDAKEPPFGGDVRAGSIWSGSSQSVLAPTKRLGRSFMLESDGVPSQ
jgi:hypothetical protein